MSDFSTGLMISVVGLVITFLALAIFIGVIALLKALFPYKPEAEEAEKAAPEAAESNEEEIVAAISAVAFAKSQGAK